MPAGRRGADVADPRLKVGVAETVEDGRDHRAGRAGVCGRGHAPGLTAAQRQPASPGGSQAWLDGSHRSSRMSASPARLRSRSQTESANTGFPEANWPLAVRLTRHSSSALRAYAKRMLQAPHHHAPGACRRAELHDLRVVPARSGASWIRKDGSVTRGGFSVQLGMDQRRPPARYRPSRTAI
jgi:hypothetical protein